MIFLEKNTVMASPVLIVVMVIIAAILLFVASLTASIGAADVFNSSFYNTDERVRSAHQYLTIAAALGWSALVVLIVILIVAAVAGGFTSVEASEALLVKQNPTKADLIAAYRGEKELSAGHTTQIIVLIILIIIAIIAFIVGILAAAAAVQLGDMRQQDDKSRTAYTEAIISAIAGIGGIGIMIVAVIAYVGIRSARAQQLAELEAFEKRAEAQLGVIPTQSTTTHLIVSK
jgi:amino acid transporter